MRLGVAALGVGVGALLLFGGSMDQAAQAALGDANFTKWDYLFKKYGAQFGVPWRWLKAICMAESSLGQNRRVLAGLADPNDIAGSTSTDGKSWGLMQVTLPTAKGLEGRTVSVAELNNPDFSVYLAAKLVRELINRFGLADRESVIRAYNGGPKFGALTLPYWTKFLVNIQTVMLKHPGDEHATS